MRTPTKDQFLGTAAAGRRTALRCRIPADLETPVSVFLKLQARPEVLDPTLFLLESVERGIQVGRYSFIGASPAASLTLRGETVIVRRRGRPEQAIPLQGRDPLHFVREEIARTPHIDGFDIPGPFAGAVGYLAYDLSRRFERLPEPPGDGLNLPDYHLVIPRSLVVFDHVRSEIEIAVLPDGDDARAFDAARTELESLLAALETPLSHRPRRQAPPGAAPCANMTRAAFERLVREAKEHIAAGDAFQIVLSQRFSGTTHTEPFQIYRALRILNPSPYMFFFDFGSFQLVGSSPEVLVRVERRRATLSPIAGTRPRGETTADDLRLEEQLLSDEKERAEHLMLVDLGRNDLGRVCETGSVRVESFMHVEKYSHVMHLVSTVTGTLRDGLDSFDVLRACFPAGTVSGAPKIRAMEIITRLESSPRGPYAGAVGYFGHDGDMDMCITIRTIVIVEGRFHVQAGAGIVADSDPSMEYEETVNKSRALIRAVEIAAGGP